MALRPFKKTHKPGWSTAEFKDKAKPIPIPTGRWVPLFRWEPGDVDLGPTSLEVELYGRPTEARVKQGRWVRLNDPEDPTDDDVTKRSGLVAETIEGTAWAGIHNGMEDISEADLPLEFRFYADRAMTLHAVIGKAKR